MVVVMIREVHLIDSSVRARQHDTFAVAVARRLELLLDGWLC